MISRRKFLTAAGILGGAALTGIVPTLEANQSSDFDDVVKGHYHQKSSDRRPAEKKDARVYYTLPNGVETYIGLDWDDVRRLLGRQDCCMTDFGRAALKLPFMRKLERLEVHYPFGEGEVYKLRFERRNAWFYSNYLITKDICHATPEHPYWTVYQQKQNATCWTWCNTLNPDLTSMN